MIRWEYQTYRGDLSDGALNEFGIDGWELVNFITTCTDSGYAREREYIFKRAKGSY